MSADNGVYIAKFPDGWRVIHAQSIENLQQYPKGSDEHKETLRRYFSKSPLFLDKNSAIIFAHELASKIEILEYGISFIGEFELWDTDKCQICKGARGGVPGNENVISVVACDYCSAEIGDNKALQAALKEVATLQDILRSVSGAVGEFADAYKGKDVVGKINFIRKDYEERIEALRVEVERLKEEMYSAEDVADLKKAIVAGMDINKSLREEVARYAKRLEEHITEQHELKAILSRYREAVEWLEVKGYSALCAEVKRRAGME